MGNILIEKAINLEKIERVPVAPVLTTYSRDVDRIDRIFENVINCCKFDGFLLHPSVFITGYLYTPCKVGQREAVPTMRSPEEYDDISSGVIGFVYRKHKMLNLIPDLEDKIQETMKVMRQFVNRWEGEKGVAVYCSSLAAAPFSFIAYHRGLTEALKDIVKYPERVMDACLAVAKELTDYVSGLVSDMEMRRVWISLTYSTPDILGGYFTQFAWSPLKVMIKRFINMGITPIIQFDVDASSMLNVLKDLPPGKYAVHVSSSSDMLKVMKELDGFACTVGNIPLSSLETAEDVKNYCKKILQGFKNTGFILSTDGGDPLIISDQYPPKLKVLAEAARYY